MKIIFLIIIIALVVSLINKKKNPDGASSASPRQLTDADDCVKYSIKVAFTDDHQQEIIDNLAIENDLYESTKSQLVSGGYIGETIPKYVAKKRDVEFVPEPDNEYDKNAIKVIIDGIHVGYVPKKNQSRVRSMLEKNDPQITWILTGGPYKHVTEEYDDYKDKEVYYLDKGNDGNLGIKITFRYLKEE